MKETETNNGIRVDLLREAQMSGMGRTEKIRFIIDRVQEGRVVVLEDGLNPDENALLIEKTMTEIDHNEFSGVDVESYPNGGTESEGTSLLDRLLGRKTEEESNLTVIGPASRMETLQKDDKQISTLLTQG